MTLHKIYVSRSLGVFALSANDVCSGDGLQSDHSEVLERHITPGGAVKYAMHNPGHGFGGGSVARGGWVGKGCW